MDARNIGHADVLLEIAAAVGLSVDDARKVLAERSFSDSVDEDWAKSRQYGVTGVPTFVAGGRGVVGAQPYEAIEQMLNEAGVRSKDAAETD